MKTVTLVTGNKDKLAEYQRIMPVAIGLVSSDVDLVEIQSFDSKVIVEDKVRRAYEQLQKPVIVEDVSAGLASLNGLPGPFIKFFEQRLGPDVLYKVSKPGDVATITCTIGYFDGQSLFTVQGVVEGSVVAPRVEAGFGFDCVFVPAGRTETFAEMGPEIKDTLSHRALAIQAFLEKYSELHT